MKQLVKDVASAGCKNSTGLLGTGNNNIILIIIVLILCSCGGAGDVLGSIGNLGSGRRRRRRGSRGLLLLIILGLVLSGNNPGRNANTNIINVDTATGEESGLGLLDL